jgi:hypothetical protein
VFEKFPETFPGHEGKKSPALLSSAALHLALLAIVVPVLS